VGKVGSCSNDVILSPPEAGEESNSPGDSKSWEFGTFIPQDLNNFFPSNS